MQRRYPISVYWKNTERAYSNYRTLLCCSNLWFGAFYFKLRKLFTSSLQQICGLCHAPLFLDIPFTLQDLVSTFLHLFHVLGNWLPCLQGAHALWLSVGVSHWRKPSEDGRWEWGEDIHFHVPNPHSLLIGWLCGRPWLLEDHVLLTSLFLLHYDSMTLLTVRHRWPHHLLEVSLDFCIT